jgi:hypothetical protein
MQTPATDPEPAFPHQEQSAALTDLSLDLLSQLDYLLSLFYAFARSETAKAFPPEKEEEYKKSLADG